MQLVSAVSQKCKYCKMAILLPLLMATACFLPAVVLASELKSNSQNDPVPSRHLGIAVESLINAQDVANILAAPYDPNMAISDCLSDDHDQYHNYNETDSSGRHGLINPYYRWYQDAEGYFVPLYIVPTFTAAERQVILAGAAEIQQKTCIRFYVYSNEGELSGFDYVRIERTSGAGCYSYVGRVHTGPQILNLQPSDCPTCAHCIFMGIAAHELLHAVGFTHTHNTPGRNEFVTIRWENIQDGREGAFEEASASTHTAFGAPYDYDSVLHYTKNSFSKNGLDTIYVHNGAEIGQRNGLSSWDAYKVNRMHGCAT